MVKTPKNLVVVGVALAGFVTACATHKADTSDAMWAKYAMYADAFYSYSRQPLKKFECLFEVPSLSDTIDKISTAIGEGEKYSAGIHKEGAIRFDREKNIYTIVVPGMSVEKKGFFSRIWSGPVDPQSQQVNTQVAMLGAPVYGIVAQFMTHMTSAPQNELKVNEVDLGDEPRIEIETKGVKLSAKRSDLSVTEIYNFKAMTVNATILHLKSGGKLVPVKFSSVINNGIASALQVANIEYTKEEGIVFPKRIMATSNSDSAGTHVNQSIEIDFSPCTVEK